MSSTTTIDVFFLSCIAGLLILILAGEIGIFDRIRPRRRKRPTDAETDDLLRALGVWAARYRVAKPTGRYLKRRETDLFAACTKVGLMWIEPIASIEPVLTSQKKAAEP